LNKKTEKKLNDKFTQTFASQSYWKSTTKTTQTETLNFKSTFTQTVNNYPKTTEQNCINEAPFKQPTVEVLTNNNTKLDSKLNLEDSISPSATSDILESFDTEFSNDPFYMNTGVGVGVQVKNPINQNNNNLKSCLFSETKKKPISKPAALPYQNTNLKYESNFFDIYNDDNNNNNTYGDDTMNDSQFGFKFEEYLKDSYPISKPSKQNDESIISKKKKRND
jgi:hypothetical protein